MTGLLPNAEPAAGHESVMEGRGYYSAHSSVQRAAAASGYPMLERAAAEVPLPAAGESLRIGDFGCAGGANEMAPMTIAIQRLRQRRGDLPIEVIHTDLPTNDFASLFALIETPASYAWQRTGIYSYAAGRSLYGPVVPDQCLHLGWTAITVHWLSAVPECQPDSAFSNLVTGEARAALAQGSRDDWHAFLAQRARELIPRGQLVVVGGASDHAGMSGAEGLFRMIDAQLRALVADGTLRDSEFARIFYPTWNRKLDEYLAPFAAGALANAFAVAEYREDATDDSARYPQFVRDGDAQTFAAAYIGFVKAVTEPSFFRWIEPDRTPAQKQAIVDAFYAGLETRIAADPATATCHWHTVTLRIVRR